MINKCIALVSVLVLSAVIGLTLVRDVADALPDQIAASFKSVAHSQSAGLDLISDGEPSDVVEGISIALMFFLCAGVVTALAGIVAARSRRVLATSERWRQLSRILLMSQLCSVSTAMLPFVVIASLVGRSELPTTPAVAAVSFVFLINLALNAYGVASWRTLQDAPTPATARHHA